MMNCYPLVKHLQNCYDTNYISFDMVDKISNFTGLDEDVIERHLYWAFYDDNHLQIVQYIAECYNFPLNEIFMWHPDKGAEKIYTRWKKKMERRWDRYRRYWIEKCKTVKRQNYDLDFKLKVLKEYRESNLSLREIAQKYEISKDKIKVWAFKFTQV